MTEDHVLQSADNGYQHMTSGDHFGNRPGTPTIEEEHGGYEKPEAIIVASATFRGKLSSLLVLQDFQNAEVWRAAVFESVASFTMTFVGILSTISTLESGFSHPVVVVAIFQALVLSLCILAAAPATGGHVNPSITWTEMLTGHINPVRALLYIMGQSLGSIIGSLCVKIVVGNTLAVRYSLGGCYLQSQVSATSSEVVGLETGRAFLLEIVLTFFVLFLSYSVALDPPRLPRIGYTLAPFIVGGIVGMCILAGGSLMSGYGGAGINPGRCIGPAVVLGGSMWTGHWVFWAGPGLSGLAMAALYRYIPPTHVQVYRHRKAARARSGGRKSNPFDAKAKNFGITCADGKGARRIRKGLASLESSFQHSGKAMNLQNELEV